MHFADHAAHVSISQEDGNLFEERDTQGAASAVEDLKKKNRKKKKKRTEGEFTLVISHFVRGLSLTGQRRAGRERQ